MLVLTRKLYESITIGNEIVVKVVSIRNGVVKLGIEAPSHVSILRSELKPFAKVPETNSGSGRERTEFTTDDQADSTSQIEYPLDFTTEFAIEIEEQILCGAGV